MDETIRLNSILTGKPDARDEIHFLFNGSFEEYFKLYIPPNIDIDRIIEKTDKNFIVGNKGIGKTALLFYLKKKYEEKYPDCVCSFIFFKREYREETKIQMEKFEKQLLSEISIKTDKYEKVNDFLSLWKLAIFTKINKDNIDSEYKIFEKDTNWDSFSDLIKMLNAKVNPDPVLIDSVAKYDEKTNSIIISERQEYNPNELNMSIKYFFSLMEMAEKFFRSLARTAVPYVLCIDELEVNNNGTESFLRDLAMVRDLIFATKYINDIFRECRYANSKAYLSVRDEVLNSIRDNIVSDELNKTIDGFEVRIDWYRRIMEYTNPLFLIWLNRLGNSTQEDITSDLCTKMYTTYFPPIIGNEQSASYFLSRTWNKPRDIIRFMLAFENVLGNDDVFYSVEKIHKATILYSKKSRDELTEELNAIYDKAQIKAIFNSLIGFKKKFSKEDYLIHISTSDEYDHIRKNLDTVLETLYRVGVIGTIGEDSVSRWAHENKQYRYDGRTFFIIHKALWYELSLQSEIYNGIMPEDIFGCGVDCTVLGFDEAKNFFRVSFEWNENKKQKGIVYKNNIEKSIVGSNPKKLVGAQIQLAVVGYNERHRNWILSSDPYLIV